MTKPTLTQLREDLLAGCIRMRFASPHQDPEDHNVYEESERFHSGDDYGKDIRVSMQTDGRFRINGRDEPEFSDAVPVFFIERDPDDEDGDYTLLDADGNPFMDGYDGCYWVLSDDPQSDYVAKFMLVALESLGITDPSDHLLQDNMRQLCYDMFGGSSSWVLKALEKGIEALDKAYDVSWYEPIKGRGSHQGLQDKDLTPEALKTHIKASLESGRIKLHMDHRYIPEVYAAMDREAEIYGQAPEGEQSTATHIYWVGTTGDLHVTGDSIKSLPAGYVPVLKIQIHMDEDGSVETASYLSADGAPLPADLEDMARSNELWCMGTDDIQPENIVVMTRIIFHALGLTPDLDLIKVNAINLGNELMDPSHIEDELDDEI